VHRAAPLDAPSAAGLVSPLGGRRDAVVSLADGDDGGDRGEGPSSRTNLIVWCRSVAWRCEHGCALCGRTDRLRYGDDAAFGGLFV
jgi:hypothetical protein